MKRVGLIVASDDGCAVFTSVEAAEGYLEAVDVEDGVYPAGYDADGRVFRLHASGVTTWNPGRVTITPDGTTDVQSLRDLIKQTLRDENVEDLPIDELAQGLASRIIA
jgi:hypothetical protein